MTKDETTTGWIVFDQVEIDLDGRRLFVSAAEMPLEPKAFAVLALLARNPGQAFTRDEILDAVWGHRHVTPGVLNRVITLLRQALGESAGASQYLHTLHGVGYRLDAQTRRCATRAEVADRSISPRTAAAASPVADLDEDARPAGAGAGAADGESTAATVDQAAAAASPSRARRIGLAWFIALGLCALIGAAYVLSRRPAPMPAHRSPTLVVLPLRPLGSAPEENVFAEGLSEELITRLARIDGLHLISQTSAARAQTDQLDLNQLAERLHVTHALEGSMRQAGQQLRIDLRLIDIPGGRTLWAQDYDRDLADVFAIQRDIAQSVAGTLALKLGLQSTSAEGDPQLFREYLEIRRRPLDRPGAAEYAKTIELLRAFVARAPDYARAHGLLARVLLQELRPSLTTPAEQAEAAREAARALELDPDQVEARAALATLACRASDWTKCMSGFRHVLALAPADTLLRTMFGRWLAATGYLDEALRQTDIATASDPLNYTAIFFRARVLDTLGKHDAALESFEEVIRVAPAAAGPWPYARWYNAIWRHDFAAARESAALMPLDEHFRDAYVAATEALVDPARWPQVEPLIEASERETGRYNFLRMLQPGSDTRKVIAALEVVMQTGSSSYNLLLWNPETAALRRDPAFQDFLRRAHIIDYWRSNGWPAQCRADGERAVCD
ncbi:MAG TPA: winged helix-turn-helix domain-containing protein [Rudaea sp.]|nr:winged helix-turn-helix domain-containing protein [Rudaea sp.]